MKISYKVLKKYIPNIKSVKEVADDLIMHTAEVEEIVLEWENLKDVFIWEVLEAKKHPDSDKLNLCIVKVLWEEKQIVCWASNVKVWIKVAIAIVWAKLTEDFIISKTKIRGETSEWMICSEDELWLIEERQEWILILPEDAPLWISMREYLQKDDYILEIDNKAINHRPDLFSHIWIIRELCAISWEKLKYEYSKRDFTSLSSLWIENEIPDAVSRYKGLKIENVKNIETPTYIKQVLNSAWVSSKWLLIDISNYSLYLYGQPTHCFDADKIDWNIWIRFAKKWEKFIALNDCEYELSSEDIVITDNSWVIALGWVIWWKESSVSDNTKSIIVEAAHFDQAIVRKTWKRLGLRTDALNIFEKDIVNGIQHAGMSLIADELEKNIEWIKFTWYSDVYPVKQKEITVPYDLDFINKLIGKIYIESEVLNILKNLGIKKDWDNLLIPFWRKDLNYKADIAEEIARINWYNEVESTVPRINLWAIKQTSIYKLKNITRDFFVFAWFFDMYNYSFVNKELMEKLEWNIKNLVPVKNALSEDMTHMKWELIPNLMMSLEKNIRDMKDLKLFEIEKVFSLTKKWDIDENYSIAWVILSDEETAYYDISNVVSDYFKSIKIDNYHFDKSELYPSFAHKWRTAKIVVRWKTVWYVWEIHPKITKNFDISSRVWFFELNADAIKDSADSKIKAKELSLFQENNFDLSFVIDKDIKWKDIKSTIEKIDKNLIQKVEIFDIFESEDKLPWKRSISFKIYIQSMTWTLDDKVKNTLIDNIVKKVENKGWELRSTYEANKK